MDPAPSIAPPKPRIVVRRQNMRRALLTSGGAAALTFGAILVVPAHLQAIAVFVCATVALVSGVLSLVLRFTEQPRQIVVRPVDYKVDYDWDPPVIH